MYLRNNPVLQHELVSNLRTPRAFLLLAAYVGGLGALVYMAWPAEQMLDFARPEAAKRLVSLFFFGQYLLASLVTPSFAAGAITGEKERQSFEMLLATPLRPMAVVFGKFVAALGHLAILMICSLPIVMLCLPLGGVSPYEVLAAYIAMIASVGLSGSICIWASSYFRRTSASLVVSYLMILPLALVGVLVWNALGQLGTFRVLLATTVVPAACVALSAPMWIDAARRLLYPPDLGSEGKEVIDVEVESREAVGLYIDSNEFPDRLFAPPKRTTLLEDGDNPVYDKEMRSEIFSQGTLMLRLVIQISMVIALPLMAGCLYLVPTAAPWYIAYVLLFNLLVGPVFSAGSVCSERERQTLDLLLTTLITPWQMLWGKLISGLRVSSVLTSFLLWPVLLACLMPVGFLSSLGNVASVVGFLVIVGLCSLTTALTALLCSALVHKTSQAMIASYLVLLCMFVLPLAARFFAETFFPNSTAATIALLSGIVSPFAAVFALPLSFEDNPATQANYGYVAAAHVLFAILYNLGLLGLLVWLFGARYRVAE